MWRIVGISLGLVGMTVAGGMGLSLVHDTVFANPTPVRAQVIRPAAVLRRVTAISPDAIKTDAPQLGKAVQVARAQVNEAVQTPTFEGTRSDETILTPRATGEDTINGVDATSPAPLISLRPKLRDQAPTRTARVTPTLTRRVIPAPARVQVHRTRTIPLSVKRSEPIRTAGRTLPPRILIGVYR